MLVKLLANNTYDLVQLLEESLFRGNVLKICFPVSNLQIHKRLVSQASLPLQNSCLHWY